MPNLLSSTLATSRQTLGRWLTRRLSEAAERVVVQARLSERVPVRVQRLGRRAWQRLTKRFPGIAGLQHVAAPAQTPVETTAPPDPKAALRDASVEVAVRAAADLGRASDSASKQALLDVLSNTDGYFHPVTRAAALQALAPRLGADEQSLLVQAIHDTDAEVSMAAITALVQHAPAHVALDALMPVLADHSGFYLPVVQDTATEALKRAGLLSHS